VRGKVTSSDSPAGLLGANVVLYEDTVATGLGAATDLAGNYVILSVPAGGYRVHLECLGYKSQILDIELSADSDTTLNVRLESQVIQLQEVTIGVSVAKHEVSVENTPLRVEVMVPEEVQDKIAFATTANAALRYSGGIVINTSKNLYESENIRLWGVDSRYLLLLSDQMPVVGFQPDNVGIWSVPLVGIRKIEIVKGDHSALYGFGYSGMINAVLRNPMNDSTRAFALVRSNFKDDHYGGVYAGRKVGRFGISTILSAENIANSDSNYLSNVVIPRIDYESGTTRGFVSGNIFNSYHQSDSALPKRIGVNGGIDVPISQTFRLMLNLSSADQDNWYPTNSAQQESHSTIRYGSGQLIRSAKSLTVVAGFDGYEEDFEISQERAATNVNRVAGFAQVDWDISKGVGVVYGGRLFIDRTRSSGPYGIDTLNAYEYHDSTYTNTGTDQFVSLLWKSKYYLSHRLTLSYGTVPTLSHYFLPSSHDFRMLLPSNGMKPERITSANLDTRIVNTFGTIRWTGNLSLFVTRLMDHVDVYENQGSAGQFQSVLRNADKDYRIPGAEVFSRLDFGDDMAALMGYTYLAPNSYYQKSPGTMLPLPQHQGNFELDWEIEKTGLRIEIEGKYVGSQKTPTNPYRETAPDYGIVGVTVEYTIGPAKVFTGVENLFNFVQSDIGPLWGPREGREFYMGVKVLF